MFNIIAKVWSHNMHFDDNNVQDFYIIYVLYIIYHLKYISNMTTEYEQIIMLRYFFYTYKVKYDLFKQ